MLPDNVIKTGMTEDYKMVEKMVANLAWKHWRRFGGEHKEIHSVAQEAFVLAWHSFDPDISKITTWIYQKVGFALRSHLRSLIKKQEKEGSTKNGCNLDLIPHTSGSRLREVLLSLSDDGLTMISIVLEGDGSLWGSLRGGVEVKNRDTLFHIMSELGWNNIRIRKTYREIRTALYE